MKLYSTNNLKNIVSLKTAVLKGLPEDNGLYMPINIPKLPQSFFRDIASFSMQEIAFKVTKALFGDVIPDKNLTTIVHNAINFPAPLKNFSANIFLLELFHGPSLAFKDFGARFMAQLMSYFNQNNSKELVVLVATSGDTGGAVAAGFFNTPGIKVVILYPKGRVSKLQEQQLTTWGNNISALEVDGSFDDCQSMVKKAFLDTDLSAQIRLTSANSINIARLIPQSFYYFEAYKQLIRQKVGAKPVFIVPSGNFGNLTAGLIAHKMGLPTQYFVASTNKNDTFFQYLNTGIYEPKQSIPTLSNAMDVGNPSNFRRIEALYRGQTDSSTWNNIAKQIKCYAFSDEFTRDAIKSASKKNNYQIDPHTAIGVLAAKKEQKKLNNETPLVVLSTAHPVKFLNKTEVLYSSPVNHPNSVIDIHKKESKKSPISTSYGALKSWLVANI